MVAPRQRLVISLVSGFKRRARIDVTWGAELPGNVVERDPFSAQFFVAIRELAH
jgi:hypothetical protein